MHLLVEKKIEIYEYFRAHGEIEYRCPVTTSQYLSADHWMLTKSPIWDWDAYDFRIPQGAAV